MKRMPTRRKYMSLPVERQAVAIESMFTCTALETGKRLQ